MTAAPTLNLDDLNASAVSATHGVVAWLRRVTSSEKRQGRCEIVAGEGRVKIVHYTVSVRPEEMEG